MCFFGDCRVIRLSPHISLTSYFVLEKQREKRASGGGNDECSSLNKTLRVETVGGPKVTILNGNEGEGKRGIFFLFFSEAARICMSICKSGDDIPLRFTQKIKGRFERCVPVSLAVFGGREEARGSILVTGL